MLEVHQNAVQHFYELCGEQGRDAVIRVAVMGSGATSSGLSLVVDTIRDTDVVSDHDGYTVIIDKELLDYCRKISIDFREGDSEGCSSRSGRGFVLHAENPVLL